MPLRRSIVAASGVLALAVGAGAAVTPAAAATTHKAGIAVSLPSSRSVYNGGRTAISAAAHVSHGVHEVVRSTTTTAYRGKHKIASGHTVRLRAGRYALAARVAYRSYALVTRHRTVSVHHAADEPNGSRCVVTAAQDDGFGDVSATLARCTNAARPGQAIDVTDPFDNNFSSDYGVGQAFTSDYVDFPAYWSSQVQAYTARAYGATHSFTTHRMALTVRDAGHRRVFGGRDSHTTGYVHVPASAKAHYAYNCASFGQSGNWIVERHEKGRSVLDDASLANVIRYRGSGTYRFPHSGTFRFDVITECTWTISVQWR